MHSKHVVALNVFLLLAAGTPIVAEAAAQRTFVASYGLAANTAFNCSIAKPCRAFSEAIGVTNGGGEVIVLDSAGYGAVTVTKSVSLIAAPGIYAGVSVFSGNGVTVNAPGGIVVLRGLSISGQGGANGILFQAAQRLRVESCVIFNMGAQGIYHQADNAELIVLDTITRDNGDSGLTLVAQNASILMDHVRSEHNVNTGFYIAPVVPSTYANATITESVFAYNGIAGIWTDTVGGATTHIQVERATMSENGQEGFRATIGAAGAIAEATLNRNNFSNNGLRAILLYAVPPGVVRGSVSENVIQDYSIYLTGDGNSKVLLSGNTGAGRLECYGTVDARSLGDNFLTIGAACPTLTTGTGAKF